MTNINKKELKAALKVLGLVNIDMTEENVKHYMNCDYLTFHDGNDGKEYCWYFDADEKDICIDIESLKEVNVEEKGLI